MKTWSTCLFCLTLIATPAFPADNGQTTSMQSTPEDFKEFSQVMQGRWISEIIWITDWPGFGKKGDSVTGYAEYQTGEDGKVINGRFYAGPGSATNLTYYDVWWLPISNRGHGLERRQFHLQKLFPANTSCTAGAL